MLIKITRTYIYVYIFFLFVWMAAWVLSLLSHIIYVVRVTKGWFTTARSNMIQREWYVLRGRVCSLAATESSFGRKRAAFAYARIMLVIGSILAAVDSPLLTSIFLFGNSIRHDIVHLFQHLVFNQKYNPIYTQDTYYVHSYIHLYEFVHSMVSCVPLMVIYCTAIFSLRH